jgi:hypothetical protein
MRLNAAIALKGLSTTEIDAEDVIERIRYLLHDMEPNVEVGVELTAFGTDFGGPIIFQTPFQDLVERAERLRYGLLRRFWLERNACILRQSLRLAHAMASMNQTRIRRVMDEIDVLC